MREDWGECGNFPQKEFDPQAILLAVRAHVRHQHSNYDALLFGGYDRHNARALVEEKVERVLEEWRQG